MNLVGTALERDHAASRVADFCRRPGGLDRFNGEAQLGLVLSQDVVPANRHHAGHVIKDALRLELLDGRRPLEPPSRSNR